MPGYIRRTLRFNGDPDAAIEQVLLRELGDVVCPRVLDAGCGSLCYVRFPGEPFIVGIDISPEQLEKNTDVDEKILGDVETYPLEANSYDAVVCWDTVEHLNHPERAIANFAQALKPGGLLIIATTNPYSLKGLLTKITPHSFHVWVYRRLFGDPNAGKPGFAPFPTTLRRIIAPTAMRRFAAKHGLEPKFLAVIRGAQLEALSRKRPALAALYKGVAGLLKVLTLGAYDGTYTDTLAVFKKRGDR
ncbi:MAG: class I SAM-dependent methyltransferase [Armatimonadota bacterium]